jgi:hypothetical protein
LIISFNTMLRMENIHSHIGLSFGMIFCGNCNIYELNGNVLLV